MTLDEYMAREGLTNAELARRVGCNRLHILRLRRRERSASLGLAAKLEKETGLPTTTFLKDEDVAA